MFSTQSDNCIPFVHIFDIISLFAAELEEPKIGISGKGLMSRCAMSRFHLSRSKVKVMTDLPSCPRTTFLLDFSRLKAFANAQELDVQLVKIHVAECQPKWSPSIMKYIYFIIESDHFD